MLAPADYTVGIDEPAGGTRRVPERPLQLEPTRWSLL